MRTRVLLLAALCLHFTSAFETPGTITDNSSNARHRVRSWLAQAANEQPAIPENQSDPSYRYTAVKFTPENSDAIMDAQAEQYAALTGWEHVGQLGSLAQYRVFRQPKSYHHQLSKRQQIADQNMAIDQIPGIEHVTELRQGRKLYKRSIPRDHVGAPGFGDRQASSNDTEWREIGDPMYKQQWHLVNSNEHGHDINVTDVWHQGITGAGVTVALIDDGLDYSSEDLLENFDYRGSYDFNDQTKLPTPRLIDDYHGTRCAGQIAAARNKVCGVGVAYGARVAGIRMLSREVTDQDEIGALNYAMDTNWIYSCSWGPNDDGATVQGPNKVIEDAFINGIEKGRAGRGSIFVFATGNGGGAGDNCNFDGYTNSIYTISIGAIDHQDRHPYYSEQCSAQLAVTYSNGDNRGIVTTDLGLRACTSKHGGTSAAAPLGAGIFALALSVRPDLTWRDVQHVAVRSAVPVDEGDADWTTVAEGRRYNHKYGFGKMDAWRIVDVARSMEHVGRQTRIELSRDIADASIPPLERSGGESTAVVRTVSITAEQVAAAKMKRVEHVTVVVDMQHDFRGNVEIWLESPHGIRSQLAAVRQRDNSKEGLQDWKFMSVKHWDEDPVGTWSLHVRNALKPKFSGKLKAWQMTVYGESTESDPAVNGTAPVADPFPADPSPNPSPVTGVPGGGKSETPAADDSSDGNADKTMRKSTAMLLSFMLFVAGAVTSALAVLFYMCRRERQLTSARWTALDNMAADEEAFSYNGGRRRFVVDRPEDDEDPDVFEFADVDINANSNAAGHDAAATGPGVPLDRYQGLAAGEIDDDDMTAGNRTHGNSSKGSDERNDGENDRLV
ncbi:pheromone processing endoprotease [Coemansia sp. RSA 485]|nr:pheromone processing endoprotease [Coemansia sp. RSA 485]